MNEINKIAELIESFLKEADWEYYIVPLENGAKFELTMRVGSNTPILVNIDIIEQEERFYGYEVTCKKTPVIPHKFMHNGMIMANRFNCENSVARCVIGDDGSIIYIVSRGIVENINKDDFYFDINNVVQACDKNAEYMLNSAMSSNNVDMAE